MVAITCQGYPATESVSRHTDGGSPRSHDVAAGAPRDVDWRLICPLSRRWARRGRAITILFNYSVVTALKSDVSAGVDEVNNPELGASVAVVSDSRPALGRGGGLGV
ncbi:hypothetical protein EVAR_81284_1 [Eumeta japonica]|uniref:Uncharacterized protein n=1 Tax=Eumeta variegata TaxID=151549 RepID=A0A4C1VZV6_EUMVA|nr:hypothetical protein EVAR_81284_1 [Eumeta japonica]